MGTEDYMLAVCVQLDQLQHEMPHCARFGSLFTGSEHCSAEYEMVKFMAQLGSAPVRDWTASAARSIAALMILPPVYIDWFWRQVRLQCYPHAMHCHAVFPKAWMHHNRVPVMADSTK